MKHNRAGYHIYRSARWRALRLEVLRRDDFKCTQCGTRGRLEVDHVIPIRKRPDLAYDMSNLQSLCASCHTKKTRIEQGHKPPDPERIKWLRAVRDMR